ncbi:MAG: hypothetical protein ABIP89_10225 [Polyangiaceae bacterium]
MIAHPRLGVFLDSQTDLELIAILADVRPRWQLVLLATEAISESTMERARTLRRANAHVLVPKAFAEVPDYVGGWDVALFPRGKKALLALLAAGREVVMTTSSSSPEHDFVRVGRTMTELVDQVERALDGWDPGRSARIDAFLDGMIKPAGALLPAFDGRH